MARKRISPIEALRLIDDIAANESFARMETDADGNATKCDDVLDLIYRIAHAASSSPRCGGGHKDWHKEALHLAIDADVIGKRHARKAEIDKWNHQPEA